MKSTTTRPGSGGARRSTRFGAAIAAGLLGAMLALGAQAGDTTSTIQVYKTPTCGCCGKWIDHLRAAGFSVESTDLRDLTALKALNGVPQGLASCHTAMIDGYVVEGHVPASDIERLLKERPKVAGLAVPGMPLGSPGMEHPDPRRHETFDVLSFGPNGTQRFSTHTP
jgi:hypothetical protein